MDRKTNQMRFTTPAILVVSSPIIEFLESLAYHLVTNPCLRLGEQELKLSDIWVEEKIDFRAPVRVKSISPITVYSTLKTADERRKTYYYAPSEREFGEHLLNNLRRKARAWYGEETPMDNASIRPIHVSNRNHHIVQFKGTVIKGWSGIYQLNLPPEYLYLAYYAGLGAKNSQGFGCVEIWAPKRQRGRRETHD